MRKAIRVGSIVQVDIGELLARGWGRQNALSYAKLRGVVTKVQDIGGQNVVTVQQDGNTWKAMEDILQRRP
jgi:hypothetical protein